MCRDRVVTPLLFYPQGESHTGGWLLVISIHMLRLGCDGWTAAERSRPLSWAGLAGPSHTG